MLYRQKDEAYLRNELFKNPTAEYRGAPFWAWNCRLDRERLGSITNFVGFPIPLVALSAHIE